MAGSPVRAVLIDTAAGSARRVGAAAIAVALTANRLANRLDAKAKEQARAGAPD